MKAIVCRAYGEIADLKLEDRPDPLPGDSELQVTAEAIGVNFPDGLLVRGEYQARPDLPFVPGMEVAGIVSAVGDGVTGFKPGDRVACHMETGAYAERSVVPAASVFHMPEAIDAVDGCALLCAYGTAHHALKQRASLAAGETLAVLGAAGSTGLAAIQIGRAMGARVIAFASSEEKRAAAREAGADEAVGYEDIRDTMRSLTGGRGADVVFDPVGGDVFDGACRAMARGGRYLVIGFASGRIPSLPVNLALLKEFSLVGVFWGNFIRAEPEAFAENMAELFAWHGEGKVRPVISERRPLAEAPAVLSRILDRGSIGKIILVPDA